MIALVENEQYFFCLASKGIYRSPAVDTALPMPRACKSPLNHDIRDSQVGGVSSCGGPFLDVVEQIAHATNFPGRGLCSLYSMSQMVLLRFLSVRNVCPTCCSKNCLLAILYGVCEDRPLVYR